MQPIRIGFFEWLLQNASKATYNLAFSNVYGLTIEEYRRYCGFSLPSDFDLGINMQSGASELLQSLCEMYCCAPENVVTTTGASEANFLVFSSLLQRGDDFVIEQPGYQPMWLTPEMLGARRISWPRVFQEMFKADTTSLQSLITKKTKLVELTNLHNPSGVLTDKNRIKELAMVAEDHHAYVLVDEIFLDGSFTPQSSSFGLKNVIVTSSPTKVYGIGGLHTGWIIAPKEIADKCQKLKAHVTGASSYISEMMTAYLLKNARGRLIERFHKRSKTNLESLARWLDAHSEWFEWVRPDGGILCFPRFLMKCSSLELCNYLLQTQNVLINPGVLFDQEGFIRISYGCDPPLFQEALDAFERGFRGLEKSL